MLTIAQKAAIYSAVKTSYTVDGTVYTPSKIYANQGISSYPSIILNYPEEELKDQNLIGADLQRSLAWLSINVFAQSSTKNAMVIAHDITRQLRTDIRQNWGALSSGTVMYKRMSQARDLSMIEIAGNIQIARMQFDIFLSYNITW